jgi:hypothetical protein
VWYRFAMVVGTFLLLLSTAFASEGPWTTPKGLHNLYVGVFGEHFKCFEAAGRTSEPCERGLPVPTAVVHVGAKIFYRTGLGKKTDVALSVPVVRAFAMESSTDPQFETTTGVGLAEGRVRQRLGSVGDLDLGVGAGVRTGALHRSTRGRVTNLGEGSTDLSGMLYAGATGPLGSRFHTTSMDLAYYFRLPLESDTPVGRIPGDEIRVSAVSTISVTSFLGLGVSADGNWRLWGEPLDFALLEAYGDDRWAAVAASQVKAGGRVVVYPSERHPYLQFSGMRTVWAKNNPLDTTLVEVAMGMDFGGGK